MARRRCSVVGLAALVALSVTRAAGFRDLVHLGTESAGGDPIPVPQIRHFKTAGEGYTNDSPMFKIQQAFRDMLASGAVGATPVSNTMRCIMFLTSLFFVVYTVFFILQTLNRLMIVQREREEKCLASVAGTVYFVPMLCILFIAARMRAVQLAHGNTELHDLPQWWVKAAMNSCCYALLAHTVLVYICTSVYGEQWEAAARKQSLGTAGKFCILLRNLVMVCMYGSFTVVCFGICVMQAPPELWGKNGAPEVSPAIMCTIYLSVLYFTVYLVSAAARAVNELGLFGQTLRFSYAQGLLKDATAQVAFAPMLCSLFIATRMRAQQLNFDSLSMDVNPQYWVEACFYICTLSVLAQTFLAVIAGYLGVPVDEDSSRYSDLSNRQSTSQTKKVAIEVLMCLALACLYTGIATIMIGLAIMEPPGGGPTPALPTSLKCIIVLTNLFFFVYCAMWLIMSLPKCVTLSQRGEDTMGLLKVFIGVRAKEAVSFCPMFSALFLGALMRALQITTGQGAPQGWCQDFMCIAAAAIFFLTVARVDALLQADTGGRLAHACTTLQYICLGILYVCAIAVVVALFTMTPENANGTGSMVSLHLD